jgi:hypothetical protein
MHPNDHKAGHRAPKLGQGSPLSPTTKQRASVYATLQRHKESWKKWYSENRWTPSPKVNYEHPWDAKVMYRSEGKSLSFISKRHGAI